MIDSPGVVFDDGDYDGGKGMKKGNVLLRNVIKVEDVEDPISIGMSLGNRILLMRPHAFFFPSGRDMCSNASSYTTGDI